MYVIPFNHCPVATAVKTASYAIPAAKYARVTANVEGAGTFTIGGVTALRGTSHTVLAGSTLDYESRSGLIALHTAPTSSTTNSGNAFTSDTVGTSIVATFWVPTGTTISGTGTWRATVEEYNMIT